MKSPPVQYTDDIAHDMVEEFILRYTKKDGKAATHSEELLTAATLSGSETAPVANGAKK